MDISLGHGGESHGRLSFHGSATFEGKLKGNPIERMFPHGLLACPALALFLKPVSSSPVWMFPCRSSGKLIEKPLNCCCGPPKLMLSEPRGRFKSPGDDPGTSRGKNMELFWRSPAFGMGNIDGLQAAGLMAL